MNILHMSNSRIILILCAAPLAAFAIYIAWLVVPTVVRAVVPEVVKAVRGA